MTHVCVKILRRQWVRLWHVVVSTPDLYLKQYWRIINKTLRDNGQWNFDQNVTAFVQHAGFYELNNLFSLCLFTIKWQACRYIGQYGCFVNVFNSFYHRLVCYMQIPESAERKMASGSPRFRNVFSGNSDSGSSIDFTIRKYTAEHNSITMKFKSIVHMQIYTGP